MHDDITMRSYRKLMSLDIISVNEVLLLSSVYKQGISLYMIYNNI